MKKRKKIENPEYEFDKILADAMRQQQDKLLKEALTGTTNDVKPKPIFSMEQLNKIAEEIRYEAEKPFRRLLIKHGLDPERDLIFLPKTLCYLTGFSGKEIPHSLKDRVRMVDGITSIICVKASDSFMADSKRVCEQILSGF